MKTLSIPIALWLVYFAAVPALQAQDTSSREDITVFVKASRQDGENNRSGNNSYSYNPTGKAIGEITYEQSVSQTGGKVISVPIQTIPCQLPPTISLTYNSQLGNGPVGYGWQIGGLSTIMMTNKSVYYHNMAECADVMDNTSYPYALDGNLIIPNEVGVLQANYPYSTIKGNILISRQEDMYTDTFQALYPDGRRASYGISNDNPQYLFPITLQTDVDGNKIVYQYITRCLLRWTRGRLTGTIISRTSCLISMQMGPHMEKFLLSTLRSRIRPLPIMPRRSAVFVIA